MLLTNFVYAQYITNTGVIDGATGNLVYTTVNPPPPGSDPFTWSGFTNTNLEGGGYSGGSIPGYNPTTGTFMFGYTPGTVAYSTPVNYALSMAGTNIQVNGFKYSWEYYNQDMSRGTLTGNINLTSSTGQVLQSYSYNMPKTTTGWTFMSGKEDFSTQYAASSVGSLNVSFSGKDDRWWAGYYGPQIRNIDVRMLYSVAPTPVPTDFSKWVPLSTEGSDFTLTKPGVVRYGADGTYVYQSFEAGTYSCTNGAWGVDPIGGVYKSCSLGTNTTTTVPKINTTTTATTDTYSSGVALLEPTTTTVNSPSTSTVSSTTVDVATTPTTTTSTPSSTVTSPVVSAPSPTTASTTTSSTSSTSSATTSSSQSNKESNSSSSSPSLALSIISKNAERDAAGAAVAQSAMSQAQQAAQQAQQEAATVASSAVSNSLTANIVSGSGPAFNGNGIRVTTSVSSAIALSSPTTMTSISSSNNVIQGFTSNFQQQVDMTPIAIASVQQPTNGFGIQSNNATTNVQSLESYSLVPPSLLTDRSNPINDIIDNKMQLPGTSNAAPIGPAVNKNTQDSEIAGGISINRMALAPAGYGDYLNFTLKDAAFYTPKEVYKNQKNVDNARALRQLTNDSRHQEMVEQQYRR